MKAARGFKASGRSGRFGAELVVTKEAEVAPAALGLKLAAELAAERSAKAEPKQATAKKSEVEA